MTNDRGPLYTAATVLLWMVIYIIAFLFALVIFAALLG